MDSNNAGNVQYDRWNENNINMNVEQPQSTWMRWDEMTVDKKVAAKFKSKVLILLRNF